MKTRASGLGPTWSARCCSSIWTSSGGRETTRRLAAVLGGPNTTRPPASSTAVSSTVTVRCRRSIRRRRKTSQLAEPQRAVSRQQHHGAVLGVDRLGQLGHLARHGHGSLLGVLGAGDFHLPRVGPQQAVLDGGVEHGPGKPVGLSRLRGAWVLGHLPEVPGPPASVLSVPMGTSPKVGSSHRRHRVPYNSCVEGRRSRRSVSQRMFRPVTSTMSVGPTWTFDGHELRRRWGLRRWRDAHDLRLEARRVVIVVEGASSKRSGGTHIKRLSVVALGVFAQRWVHLTPSNANYGRNLASWLKRQSCW